ncbi:DNA polymerase beta domain protein region [Methanocaldococcus lauensis]|uniref:protein adenylyltransferase n=1 Tax=Methanocaldococcus lauensis TaxID=2546128 RepID=A0A8D6PUD5_9EURY|nr:nucleotidyltransferase family protein [Methanocaldococcus lauensis]CAB3290140.1 DNA polymerase beta domain protein region [Methanocaldococcus lauensis]
MNVNEIKAKIIPILLKHGVKRASIFGSYARGEQKDTSDVDILVEFGKGKSLLDLVRLKYELEEVLGKKVDLLTYNSIHPLLKDRILKEAVDIL